MSNQTVRDAHTRSLLSSPSHITMMTSSKNEKCQECSSSRATTQRVKGIVFDMHEQIIALRKANYILMEANSSMNTELNTLRQQKVQAVDVDDEHVEATNVAVAKAVGTVVVRYEKKLSNMEQKMENYRNEIITSNESLYRLRRFCHELPTYIRVQIIYYYKKSRAGDYTQTQQFKQDQNKDRIDFSERVSIAAAKLRDSIPIQNQQERNANEELNPGVKRAMDEDVQSTGKRSRNN